MTDKYVLISGAAGGIGRATVSMLAKLGFTVFAGVLNEAEAKLLGNEHPQQVIPIELDVSDEVSIRSAMKTVAERMDPDAKLLALINNAGVNYNAPLQYLTVAEIRQMVDVNLLGPILLTRAALPLLRHNCSRVVFTSSASGFMGSPTVSTYCATKFGIEGLVDSLRLEFRPLGIRVSAIEPGVVRTPMTAAAPGILQSMLGRMNGEDRDRYETTMRKIVDISSAPDVGISPEKIAEAIYDALTAPRPKSRYQVGIDSKVTSYLRHLPDAMRDLIQCRIFGL